MNDVLAAGSDVYQAVSEQVDETFSSLSQDAAAAGQSLNGLAGQIQTIIDRYAAFRDSLQGISDSCRKSFRI